MQELLQKHAVQKHAVQNHTFQECEVLREVVEWMNSRNEHLNQDKSMNALIKEYLRSQTV